MYTAELTWMLLESFEMGRPSAYGDTLQLPGYTGQDISNGIDILHKAGLLTKVVARDISGLPFSGTFIGLTFIGKSMLMAMRNAPIGRATESQSRGSIGSLH